MNALTIDIRWAEPEDAADIAAVHHASWQGAYAGIIPHRALNAMLGRRGAQWWARAIRRATRILVAEVGGVVVGYTTFGPNRARLLPQEGEIYELYVQPEYQGIGLGSRLFTAARGRLAEEGLQGTVVWALEENDPAVAFYFGAGGTDIAEGSESFDGKSLKKVAFAWN